MKKLFVKAILFYIKFWAKTAISIHKPITIGVAGSVGKSSTRNAIYAILKDHASTRFVYGNSETGVPLGILGIGMEDYSLTTWIQTLIACPFRVLSIGKYKYMVVEMGIDDPMPPKNMNYLLSIIKPDIAISLNVSATHTQQFEKLLHAKPKDASTKEFLLQKIAEEDTKIILNSSCKLGIYNSDDPYITSALLNYPGKVLRFGKKSDDIKYVDYKVDLTGTEFKFEIQSKIINITFKKQVLPEEYREVFAATLLVAHGLNLDLTRCAKILTRDFQLPKGRGSIFTGVRNTIIIDSSYNSSAKSVVAFLNLLKILSRTTKKRVVFIMGDMRELGNTAETEHSDVVKQLSEVVDTLYCVGPLTRRFVIPNVPKNIKSEWFANSLDAGKFASKNIEKESIILVKGSQNEIFLEEAIKILLKNNSDISKLCRQGDYWKRIKKNYFASASSTAA